MPDLLTEITHAARSYYRQTNAFQLTATDLFDWKAQLSPTRHADLLARGLAVAQTEVAFLRYCLEQRGYSMRAHMAENLSVAAFDLWEQHHEFNGDLPDHFSPLFPVS